MNKKELNKNIGQHLLVDQEVMDRVVEEIPRNLNVMEIGAGPGLLTRHLVERSKRVVAVEIDKSFEKDLSHLVERYDNLEIVYCNALDLLTVRRFRKFMSGQKSENWVAGNIPYHIIEPLMMSINRLPIRGATFLVGARFANEISAGTDSTNFGKLTLLVNTFFHVEVKSYVDKRSFDPPPRTTSAIVVLYAKSNEEILSNQNVYLVSELFLSSHRGTKLKNVLREAIIRYKQYMVIGKIESSNKFVITKNEARGILDTLDLPNTIWEKSVEQLNNEDFRTLAIKIQTLLL